MLVLTVVPATYLSLTGMTAVHETFSLSTVQELLCMVNGALTAITCWTTANMMKACITLTTVLSSRTD